MTDKSPTDKILEAEILIRTRNPDKISRAETMLREVIEGFSGSQCAIQARELLDEVKDLPIHLPPFIPEDKKKAGELQDTWVGIASLRDSHLYSFLADLFDLDIKAGEVISGLRHEVIKALSEWILKIDNETWLSHLVKPVVQHPEFEHQLDKVLETWWEARFNEQYLAIKPKVDNALINWDVDTATQCVSPLLNLSLPKTLREKVTQLQQEMGYVEDDKHRLETLLREFSDKSVTNWSEVQKLTTPSQELQPLQIQSRYVVPHRWQNEIEAKLQAFYTQRQKFIENQAQACRELPAVREFYREFNQLGINEADLEVSWFKKVQKTYQENNNDELKPATSVTQVEQIRQRILDEKMSLPAEFADWLQNRADAVSRLINQWQQIIEGVVLDLQGFENLEGLNIAMPEAFKRDIPKYQSLWQQLLDIEQQVDTKNAPTESDFQTATADLEKILAKYPKHQYAQDLLSEVETKHQCHRFVQALQQWDIDEFLQHCRTASPTETVQPYLQLAEYKEPLRLIKQFYQAKNFSNSQEATTWWENWHRAVNQLPDLTERPAQFSEQLEKIALERRREWFEILDTLLDNPKVVAAVCHEAAAGLENWQGWSAHFLKYYKGLTRVAWHQETTECMAAKDWQGAQNAIAQFENAGGDKTKLERLKVLRAVIQASAESIDGLADVLSEQWFLIKAYLSDELVKWLYKAIRYTWQNNDRARLAKLKDLARSIPDAERSKLLGLCLKWLDIEDALTMQEVTPSILLKFARLVFVKNGYGIRYLLREPMNQLVAQWQHDNYLLFAWIYIAGQRVQPPLIHGAAEPLTQLIGQSQQTVTRVKKNLAQLTDISDTDLDDAQTMLDSEQNVWQNLANYINLLPFTPAQQPHAPDNLDKVNNLVNELKQVKQHLIDLEDADLRENEFQSKLFNVQKFVRDQLPGFSVRDTWLNRVEALEPLTRLNFFLSQFDKATRCFGSPDPTCLAQRDLLVTMREYLLKIIKRFEHAKVVEHGMWQMLSRECWILVCQEGGVLNPVVPDKPDLQALCDLLPTLDEEEKRFRLALIKLYEEAQLTYVPSGAQLDVSRERYQAFFAAIPTEPPRTRRGYGLFKKEADKEPMATLLEQALGLSQLPTWVNNFLEEGIP